jgi:hypothetical protein
MTLERIWSWVNTALLLGFALLLVLKLAGVIGWTWWLVFSPLILLVVVFVAALTIMGLFFPNLLESEQKQQPQGGEAGKPPIGSAHETPQPPALARWLDAVQGIIIGTVIFGGCAGLAGWGLYRYYGEKFSTFWGGVFAAITIAYGFIRATIALTRNRGK